MILWATTTSWRPPREYFSLSRISRIEVGVVRSVWQTFQFPERDAIKELYPHFHHKTDKMGRPVYIERLGQLQVDELLKVTTMDRMLLYHVKEWEILIDWKIPACSKKAGTNISQTLTILDMKGVVLFYQAPLWTLFGLRSHVSWDFLSFFWRYLNDGFCLEHQFFSLSCPAEPFLLFLAPTQFNSFICQHDYFSLFAPPPPNPHILLGVARYIYIYTLPLPPPICTFFLVLIYILFRKWAFTFFCWAFFVQIPSPFIGCASVVADYEAHE